VPRCVKKKRLSETANGKEVATGRQHKSYTASGERLHDELQKSKTAMVKLAPVGQEAAL
jgi:hypothetical protein